MPGSSAWLYINGFTEQAAGLKTSCGNRQVVCTSDALTLLKLNFDGDVQVELVSDD